MNGQQIIDLMHRRLLPAVSTKGYISRPDEECRVPASGHYQPVFPYTLHSHPFFEWVWCVEKEALLQVNNKIFRLQAGEFFFLTPGEMHADIYTPELKKNRILWCACHNGRIGAHLHEYQPVNHQIHIGGISAPAPLFYPSLLGALQHECNNKLNYSDPVCASLLQALIHLMLRAFEEVVTIEPPEFIPGKVAVRVDHYLKEHFRESISLTSISHAMYVSRNYLATLYKQETGTTIGLRLKQIRLEHAKKLLLETDLSVREVAKSVGYTAPEHFSRIFQQQEGVPPGRYGK